MIITKSKLYEGDGQVHANIQPTCVCYSSCIPSPASLDIYMTKNAFSSVLKTANPYIQWKNIQL